MAKWIESIPQWIELYPDWVEGLETPRWVECGWTDFNPIWIDGPVCPTTTVIQPQGMGWDTIGPDTSKQAKIKHDDEVVLTAVLRCALMLIGNPYGVE